MAKNMYSLMLSEEIVGAIDNDDSLVGRDIGEVCDLGHSTGILISKNAEGQ